jgi:prepilin-type N-terminal cleavage/methylation domain-containing protein
MESSGSHGFTLIEIIVTVALLLVLSGLFMTNYTGFTNAQSVKQAASSFIRNLQAVRTNASSGNKPAGCDTLVGYIVKFPPLDAASYTAQAVCQGGEIPDITTYSLPTGVTFSPIPSSITFYALDRGASGDQTISVTGFGMTAKVSVFASGVISDFTPTPGP